MSTAKTYSTAAQPDVRSTREAADVTGFYSAMFAPGTGLVHAARDLCPLPDGGFVMIGTTFAGALEDGPSSNAYRIDAVAATITQIRADAQRLAVSADGRSCAIAADGAIHVLDLRDGNIVASLPIDGIVEQLRWSPGGKLGLLVAGARADVSGAEGGFARQVAQAGPDWLPEVDSGDADDVWRRLWAWDGVGTTLTAITAPPVNIWEFDWATDERLVVVASDHHGEGSWYSATLRFVERTRGQVVEAYRPKDQIGKPVASMDGTSVAFIEAVCSDRGIVCGTLRLCNDEGVRTLATGTVDITDLHWQTPRRIVVAGLRGLETVIGHYDLDHDETAIVWASTDRTCGDNYPAVTVAGDSIYAIMESYREAPALHILSAGEPRLLWSFAASDETPVKGHVEAARWTAPDGLTIEGLLLRPHAGAAGLPLVVDIHGGPIWAYRTRWAPRFRAAELLAARGFAVLFPNPRGSGGRGQDFARAVVGDMGGADVQDLLSGIDHLAAEGIVDRDRVVLTGTSYGGFMSAWLPTRHARFAAAIPISPVSNWYSQHFTSQIPSFDELCLDGSPTMAGGQYFDRSPVFFADRVRTPTLILAGGRDKNTPPTQALELHHALLYAGATSVLCTYPGDGHSLRGYPAYLDSAVRVILWAVHHTHR